MAAYDWSFGSYHLTKAGQVVALAAGLDGAPARKNENAVVPGREGRTHRLKPHDQRVITVPLTVTAATRAGLLAALDELSAVLTIPVRQTLSRGMADGTTRTITAEAVNAIPYMLESHLTARFVIEFLAAEPYWQASAASHESESGIGSSPHAWTIEYGGSAPHEGTVITLAGDITNPKLAAGDYWVQYTGAITAAGGDLVVDCETFEATYNGADVSGAITHGGGLAWFALMPGSNVLTLTGTGVASVSVDIDYYERFL